MDHPDPDLRDPYSHGSLVVGNSFPWVTHRRSPKLVQGHSQSRGKADFTFNSESSGLVVRAAHSFLFRATCAPLLAQPLIGTRHSSLRARQCLLHRCPLALKFYFFPPQFCYISHKYELYYIMYLLLLSTMKNYNTKKKANIAHSK